MKAVLSVLLSLALPLGSVAPASAQALAPIEVPGAVATPVLATEISPQIPGAEPPGAALAPLGPLHSLASVSSLVRASGLPALGPLTGGAAVAAPALDRRTVVRAGRWNPGRASFAFFLKLRIAAENLASRSPKRAPEVLDGLFAEIRRGEAVDALAAPPVLQAWGRAAPGLSGLRARGASRRAVPRPVKPRSSLRRSINCGFVAAGVSFLVSTFILAVSSFLGYQLHPNYGHGAPSLAGLGGLLLVLFNPLVFAPAAEEMIFRVGLYGGLKRLASRFHQDSATLLASGLSALIFVLLHERADPVMIVGRMFTAVLLNYVYEKEGLPASMAMHAFFNAMFFLPSLGLGGPPAALGLFLGSALFFRRALQALKAEARDRAEGRIVPYRFGAKGALLTAAVLGGGVALGWAIPFAAILYGAAALGWLVYAGLEFIRRRRGPA